MYSKYLLVKNIYLYFLILLPIPLFIIIIIYFFFSTINTLAGDQFKPEFLKINPMHCVPTLDDNGFILWDSHVICTYLATKYSTDNIVLCPQDPCLRAKLDLRMHYNNATLFARYYRLIAPIFFGNDTELKEESIADVLTALDFLEIFLKDDDYLVGKSLTVADLCTVTTVTTIIKIMPNLDTARYTKTLAWVERLSLLPYFKELNTDKCDAFYLKYIESLEKNKVT